MTVNIIGAGIGGLTTAVALQRKGIKVQVFEQAAELKPVGAGIILANNAMQVYEKLGLKPQIENHGNPISSMKITAPSLSPLSCVDLKYFETKYNCQNIAIHRGALQQILIEALEPNTLKLGYKLAGIEASDKESLLKFENSKEISSQVTLGADGLSSTVRKNLFPNTKIRSASQVCWRGVVDISLPPKFQNELNEAWGKGERFGFVQIQSNKVYWYALKSFKTNPSEHSVEKLSHYFSVYNDIIRNIIESTPTKNIHTATIDDLKPIKTWFKGNICLIGDAAHATTPNMGQGACQAIEDARVLSECLSKYGVIKAFEEYQKLRLPKAHQVVNTSWQIGKMAHWKNPMATKLRDQLIKMTPRNISRKQSEQIFKLETV
ncbi:FAD-dependent monooxygenase [Fulvivirga sp. 29W222]|uniref:FAD-dependent monooxygenase n=1 Tax=Fulvivirga marina TaxID=2494733 RepID=A0A937KCR1_9BACT|nr:FAD-dependent monooxygenase [Fulvivirga marina]MBL6447664.1 FAD-dependent monooxygenase [Fulvivirga marina]